MFYSKFAKDYEEIFPFDHETYSFLNGYLPDNTKNILDIGCATGHYCGRFAADGFEPTGIDLDKQMIMSAKKTYPSAEFSSLNLTEIHRLKSTYNMVYSTGNVMAHIPVGSFTTFLESLKGILSEDGIWIFQVINWDYILNQKTFSFPVKETESKIFYREYTDITNSTLQFNTKLKDRKSGNTLFEDNVTMYPVHSEQYITMHQTAGFKMIGHYAGYGKMPFESNNFSADIYIFKHG